MPNYKGKHLWVSRGIYTHHGIGVGNNRVVHYSGLADGLESGPVCIVSAESFSSGSKIEIEDHPKRKYSVNESVERAMSRIGENDYSVFDNNCEHFVHWCIDGEHFSGQAEIAKTATKSSSSGIAIGGGVAIATAVVATAPVVIAASVGFGAYKLWKWMTD